MSHDEATQARFAATAARLAALGDRRVHALRERLGEFVRPRRDEVALDAGTGTGPLAVALAPLVREVVGLDLVPAMLDEARARAARLPNVRFVLGDALALPFDAESFDLTATVRTLHHLERPDVAIAEMARVTRPGGRILVADQLTSSDPREAEAYERIERLRDPAHVRTLSDAEIRALLAASGLELERAEQVLEERELGEFLDLAGCEDEDRRAVLELVGELVRGGERAGIQLRRAGEGYAFTLSIGWYLALKPDRGRAPTDP